MKTLRVSFTSPPDRERLVAEVFQGSVQLAEINQERPNALAVEIYPRPDGEPWKLDLDALLAAFNKARQELGGK